MHKVWGLLGGGFFLALTAVLVQQTGIGGSAEVPPETGKKVKSPPSEEERIHKAIDKMLRPAKTERNRLLKDLAKVVGEGTPLERPGAGDEEFRVWFDLLSGGEPVWREANILRKPLREFYARVAGRLGNTTGEIHRDEFLRYAREFLAEGRSPPWDQKPPKNPLDEAAKRFAKLDRNHNGILSHEEMPPDLHADLRSWDSDRDGQINEPEFLHYVQTRFRALARERGLDQPRAPKEEAEPEANDAPPALYRPGNMPADLPGWFLALDGNGDGQIGLYEWKARAFPINEFLHLDRNQDGFITVEEWQRLQRLSSQGEANQGRGVRNAAGASRPTFPLSPR
jgi:hypothetical protein